MVKAPSPHLKHLPWAHHRNTWNSQIFDVGAVGWNQSPQPQTSACIKRNNLWSFVLNFLAKDAKGKIDPKIFSLKWWRIQRIRKKVTNSTNPSSVTTWRKQPFFTQLVEQQGDWPAGFFWFHSPKTIAKFTLGVLRPLIKRCRCIQNFGALDLLGCPFNNSQYLGHESEFKITYLMELGHLHR